MKNSSKNKVAISEEHTHCEKCHGTGFVQRSIPLGEALAILQTIFKKLSEVSKEATDFKVTSLLTKKKFVFPKVGTKPCEDYFKSLSEIDSYLSFIVELVSRIESIYSTIDHITSLPGGEKIHYKDEKTGKDYRIKTPPRYSFMYAFSKKQQFIMEVILVRLVENYLNYLSSLLYEIFIQKPETMKSGEKIEISSVLSHDSFKSLIRTIAEKKISNLTYSSFKDLSTFFSEQFKLRICSDAATQNITLAIELRNISVHNRCKIDQRFIERTKYDPTKKGKVAIIDLELINNLVSIFVESVMTLDTNARNKLKLRGKRFSSEKADKPKK
jgi:hypothetical protein